MSFRTIAAITAGLLAASTASAANFSFTGTFAQDNGKAGYAFTLANAGTVTLQSLGYAGGTNAAGATVARGGFDTVLSLYDSTGQGIAFQDDGSPSVDTTGHASDALFSGALAAGTYTVFLTQYNNFGPFTQSPGLHFAFDGQPNFRNGFVDFYNSQRDGHWALDLIGVDSATTAAVPEAATWALMLVGFGAVGATARRRRVGAVAA